MCTWRRTQVEDGLQITTKLINNIHKTGEWPKDVNKVTMTALKKIQRRYKMQRPTHFLPYRTYNKDSSEDTYKRD